MKRAAFASGVLLAGLAPLAAQPRLEVADRIVHLPDSYQGTSLESRFELRNAGDEPLEIVRIESGRHRVEAPDRIEPGDVAELVVSIDPDWRLGQLTARVRVHSNDPERPISVLAARGFFQSSFLPESPALNLGAVASDDGARADLLVECVDQPDLELEPAQPLPPGIGVTFEPEPGTRGAVRLTVVLEPGIEPGIVDRFLVFRTNSPNHELYRLRLSAQVFGTVVPDPRRLDLGAVTLGEPTAVELQLLSPDVELVWEEPVLPEGVRLISVEACDAAPACRHLALEVTRPETGFWTARLAFPFSDRPTLEVPISGLVVDPGVEVTHLGNIDELRAGRPAPAPSTAPATSTGEGGSSAAIATGRAPGSKADARSSSTDNAPAEETPARNAAGEGASSRPVLRWQVARQDRLYGYYVNRATERTGPFVRVNEDLIHRRRETEADGTTAYTWEDRGAEAGRTYYYFIDAVGVTGAKQPLSGVLSRTVPE